MTVLEKIKKCVSLVWDFQEIYGEEDIEEFCHNELSTYPQHNEIMDYFKQIENLEKENHLLGERCNQLLKDKGELTDTLDQLQEQNSEMFNTIALQEQQIEELKGLNNELLEEGRLLKEQIAELQGENAELKDYRLNTMAKEQTEMSKYALNLENKLGWYDTQLTKAKEIISEYIRLANLEKEDTVAIWQLYHKAEQFLKGENIILEDAQAGNSPFDADKVFNKEMKAYPEEKVK